MTRPRRALPARDADRDRAYWTKKLREAEAELEAARTRTAVNAAAKKLQRAKAALEEIEGDPRRPHGDARRARLCRLAFPHDLLGFVDLETRLLQVLHDPLGEHLARVVRRVLCDDPAQRRGCA